MLFSFFQQATNGYGKMALMLQVSLQTGYQIHPTALTMRTPYQHDIRRLVVIGAGMTEPPLMSGGTFVRRMVMYYIHDISISSVPA